MVGHKAAGVPGQNSGGQRHHSFIDVRSSTRAGLCSKAANAATEHGSGWGSVNPTAAVAKDSSSGCQQRGNSDERWQQRRLLVKDVGNGEATVRAKA
eukprot:g42904.t1